MKKLFFLLLSVVLFSTVAGAQDENRENGKVILKNGSVVEGTISKQGNDVVVTTAGGDVFYYSASEIARISRSDAGTSKGVKTDVNLQSTVSKSGFKAFKKNTRAAYREAKAFGTDINKYWGTNDKAKYYYEKSRKWDKAAGSQLRLERGLLFLVESFMHVAMNLDIQIIKLARIMDLAGM